MVKYNLETGRGAADGAAVWREQKCIFCCLKFSCIFFKSKSSPLHRARPDRFSGFSGRIARWCARSHPLLEISIFTKLQVFLLGHRQGRRRSHAAGSGNHRRSEKREGKLPAYALPDIQEYAAENLISHSKGFAFR
jgi:hypothetical protein